MFYKYALSTSKTLSLATAFEAEELSSVTSYIWLSHVSYVVFLMSFDEVENFTLRFDQCIKNLTFAINFEELVLSHFLCEDLLHHTSAVNLDPDLA